MRSVLDVMEISQAVRSAYPDCRVLCIGAENFANGPSNSVSDGFLREAERRARALFAERAVAEHAHILAWREVYSSFGSKPSKYFSSVESLLRRVVKGDDLPRICRAVDAYNAVSLNHVLPVGAEDLDVVAGKLRLRFAIGGEPFDSGDGATESAAAGEVVWSDDVGVTCRRWNWRQGSRTRITNDAKRIVFVLERLEPMSVHALELAGAELVHSLRQLSPDARYEVRVFPE